MNTMTVSQGYALQQVITIRDYIDNPIVTYTGMEAMTGTVRPGRSFAPSITFTPTWGDPASGTVNVNLTAAQTATLTAGQHLMQVGLADKSAEFYEGFLVVSYSGGTAILPSVYCDFDDLLTYAPWIMNLQTTFQVAGFAIERGLARNWLDQIIVNHSAGMFLSPQIGQPGFMPLSLFPAMNSSPPNLWIREQLNLDYLVRRENVIEMCAKRAIATICQSQLDVVNDKEQAFARRCERTSNAMASSLRAEITLGVAHPNNQDTWPSLTIDCARSSLRG